MPSGGTTSAIPLLSQYVTDALAQNLDLAQATARMAQARAGLSMATAALLPSGNISGQAARAYQSAETPQGQVLSATPDYNRYGNSYETNLNASWEIDIFGGCAADVRLLRRVSPRPAWPSQRNDLLELMDDRYGKNATVMISQLLTDEWCGCVGDNTLADATLDRLMHNSHRLEMKGESMRKVLAQVD